MFCWLIIIFISSVYALPATLLEQLTGNTKFTVDDNSLIQYDKDNFSDLDIYFQENLTDSKKKNYTKEIIPFSTEFSDRNGTTLDKESTTAESPISPTKKNLDPVSATNENNVNGTLSLSPLEPNTVKSKANKTTELPISQAPTNIDPVSQTNKNKVNDTRLPRQGKVEITNASQEDESSEEEEGGNMITGLLSAFLSGLSRPDGSIDLEAIIGLLGSLSTQNPDGTYDFNGLTELLRSFLGGGADGGGSDIGSFIGGLLGAVIKGVANPPGPKGAGILTGKIVTGILPALSGPVPPDNDVMMPGKPNKAPPLDSGSFLTGLLKTVLGSGGNGTMDGGKQSKYTLFKLIFSAITGVFSAASSLSSKSDWN